MAQQDGEATAIDDQPEREADSLSETQIALMLRHAPDRALARQVETAKSVTTHEWREGDENREEDLARLRNNDHYEFTDLGWQIIDDPNMEPAVRVVVVTPVPDWEDLRDLDEVTRTFISEWKETTMTYIRAMQRETGLSPEEFTAMLIDIFGDGDLVSLSDPLGRSPEQLQSDLDGAENALSEARALANLTPTKLKDYIL